MKKGRIRIFDDDKSVFSTPDVFDEDGSRVGSARIFINIYGYMVAEIENRHLGTGYYSKSTESVCADLNDDTLDYLLAKLQCEHDRRCLSTFETEFVKHGEWNRIQNFAKCSECMHEVNWGSKDFLSPYCPKCGAKMKT